MLKPNLIIEVQKGIIREYDLRRWARIRASEIGLDNFSASNTWLSNFKHNYKVGSRKITKNRSRAENRNSEMTRASINDFRLDYGGISHNFSPRMVWNVYQTKFNYEFTSDRTLNN